MTHKSRTRKLCIALMTAVLPLCINFPASAFQQAPGSTTAVPGKSTTIIETAAPAESTSAIASSKGAINTETTKLQNEVSTMQTIFEVALLLAVLLLAIVGFFGFTAIKRWIRKFVEDNLERSIAAAMQDSLPRVLSAAQTRAEEHIFRLAKLLALQSQGAYDEALQEFGWDGSVSSLRKETAIFRRNIIECLNGATQNRERNRIAGWEALNELVRDDTSNETIRLFLKLAVSYRKFQEGYDFYVKHQNLVEADKNSAILASTLLRKLGKLTEARDLANKFQSENDLSALVAVAVLERDLGQFDEVHDRLLPAVQKLIGKPMDLPEGWHRLLNTFVANCIDRGHPEDAIQSAEFVLRSAPAAVTLFTVGRLILSLPKDEPSRKDLINKYRDGLSKLIPSDATTKGQAILHQIDNENEKAVTLLKDAISSHQSSTGRSMHPDLYFLRCNLGELLTESGQTSEAIDILMPASAHSHGGEAKYRLAIAYAARNENEEASRWLRQAIDELPKWAQQARDNKILKNKPEVAAQLAKQKPKLHK